MSFTVTILINGQPILTRTAVNTGSAKKVIGRDVEDNKDHPHIYEVDTGVCISHIPSDGAVVLAKKLLDTIKEPGKGE